MTKGARIKKTREKLGIAQSDLAKRMGISKQSLYKYENDIVTNIPSDIIEALSVLLDVSPAYLMGWEEEGVNSVEEFEQYYEKHQGSLPSHLAAYLDMFSKLSPKSREEVLDYMNYQIEKEGKNNGSS